MKKQFKSVFIVILFVLWTALSSTLPGVVEPQSSYSEAIKEFEKFVEEQMALDKAPGLSVGFKISSGQKASVSLTLKIKFRLRP